MRYCPPLDICHFWCSLVLYNAGYVDMWEYVRTLLYLFPRAVFFISEMYKLALQISYLIFGRFKRSSTVCPEKSGFPK